MFIQVPFLPKGRVTHVLVDRNAPDELIKNLEKIRITPVPSAKVAVLEGVSTHPDMQIFHLGANRLICEPSVHQHYSDLLKPLGFEVICGKTKLLSNYPSDVAYNIARIGNYAVHKKSCTDDGVLTFLELSGVRIIDVAQGYTKCAICIINENAAITSDLGIAKALGAYNIEILTIEKGGIRLEGMDYGFIGGACGLVAPNLLAFCGNIEKHGDYKKIKDFAKKHSVDIVSLCSGGLVDIGSIIPIKQEVIDWNSSQ